MVAAATATAALLVATRLPHPLFPERGQRNNAAATECSTLLANLCNAATDAADAASRRWQLGSSEARNCQHGAK